MVLRKLPVPRRPTDLDNSRTRAYCACSEGRWGLFWTLFLSSIRFSSVSLSLGGGPILTYTLSKGRLKPKQPTNLTNRYLFVATVISVYFIR